MSSRRESIIATVAARLGVIAKSDGFLTDMGSTLTINDYPQFGPDDPRQALVLMVGDEDGQWRGRGLIVNLPMTCLVLVDADLTSDGWRAIEQGISDVKRAIEIDDDRSLGGLLTGPFERGNVEVIPREPGSLAMGAVIPYTLTFKDAWGG